MKRIRIAIDGSLACSSRPTGVEHFARSLLAELLELEAPDVDWFLYLSPLADPGPVPKRVTIRRRPDVNTLIKTPWFIAQTWRDRVDLVYAFGHLLPPYCLGRRVVTVHDTAFDQFPDCYPDGNAEQAHSEVSAACRSAARVVVPSRATLEGLRASYNFPPDRVDVILEGSRPWFTPGDPAPLPDSLLSAGIAPPFFLCVGRLDRRKNLERVIDAYRSVLRSEVPCGGLVIAGPPDSGSEAVRARLDAGRVAGEKIVAAGYVSEPDLVNLYRSAAAVVYPSLAEGFGLPVLEAMACGTPVITSNVSSMPEVAGEAALLVDPKDTEALSAAMRRILQDPDLCARLSSDGLARAREFTWRRSAERLLECFRRAAAPSEGGAQ